MGKVPKEEGVTIINFETGWPKFHVFWRLGRAGNGAFAKG